ncbi:MAG: hypothetical protein ACI9U2_001573 [Bradymonadia bacterium]|jgi:hypothetical protein
MSDASAAHPIDAQLGILHANRTAWARLPIARKIEYLDAFIAGTAAAADAQVEAACAAKGITRGSPQESEEYFAGPVVQIRTARLIADSLRRVAAGKAPYADDAVSVDADGHTWVKVFPTSRIDALSFTGFTAQVRMQDHVTPTTLRTHTASFYSQTNPQGAVALVLGAGNVASIGPLDVLQKLFVEGQVCILKYNPVNAYLAPFIERAFSDLIRDGFVRTAAGGVELGQHLCTHPLVEEIHITGSDRTHDAIVYGVGPQGAANKAADTPINPRRLTSELGNVSPVIVVPGLWTGNELRFQAEHVATQLANNGGFNCNACRVIILHAQWPQRRAFMDALRAVLSAVTPRVAYYPGAADRYAHFLDAYPQSQKIGPRIDGGLPWGLIPDVPADDTGPAFTEESFCGVVAQTALPGADAEEFLRNAVAFCNDRLWGTLSASLIVDPRTAAQLGEAVDAAIEDLRYGTVVVNHWAALAYAFGSTPWGAAPGHVRTDIQSGVGVVHNAYLLESVEKTVIRGPFKVSPKPPWFVTHKTSHRIARKMVDLEKKPTMWRLPGIVVDALQG